MASLSTCHLGLWLGWQILLNLVKSTARVANLSTPVAQSGQSMQTAPTCRTPTKAGCLEPDVMLTDHDSCRALLPMDILAYKTQAHSSHSATNTSRAAVHIVSAILPACADSQCVRPDWLPLHVCGYISRLTPTHPDFSRKRVYISRLTPIRPYSTSTD